MNYAGKGVKNGKRARRYSPGYAEQRLLQAMGHKGGKGIEFGQTPCNKDFLALQKCAAHPRGKSLTKTSKRRQHQKPDNDRGEVGKKRQHSGLSERKIQKKYVSHGLHDKNA